MVSSLESTFSKEEMQTLLDSITDWEISRNQEYHVMQMVKNIPLPAEDDESYEYVSELKRQFRLREDNILDSRMARQEKAIFLKAKLMMVIKDMGRNELFDFEGQKDSDNLKLAEKCIKEAGLWDDYVQAIEEQKS